MLNVVGKHCQGCDNISHQAPGENPQFDIGPTTSTLRADRRVDRCNECGRVTFLEVFRVGAE